MNKERAFTIFENYIENFDVMNNDENREYMKWSAVACFHKYWDIDATDFAAMFKNSMQEAKVMIDNRAKTPTFGIIKLAEKSEYCEKVREQFRNLLYTDDGGNIGERQKSIETFVERINALLEECEPGKWKISRNSEQHFSI